MHFEFGNIYLTQEMQNDWTMNIKQNVMSHTKIINPWQISHLKIQNGRQSAFFFHYLGNLDW